MEESATATSYVWQVPAKPVAVHLSLDLVDRLAAAVKEGFKALPRRGLETGGLLLGSEKRTADGIVVFIEEFEPLECEHAFGPSYLLSATDRRLLQERLSGHKPRRGPAVVGFYRSHTRKEFALTVEDLDLMADCFSRESNVLLLLQSNGDLPPTAGFAIWEGKKIRSAVPYATFPFSRAALDPGGVASPVLPRVPASPVAPLSAPVLHGQATIPLPPPPLLPPVPPHSRSSRWERWRWKIPVRRDWGWIAAAAIVLTTLLFAAARRDGVRPSSSVPLGLDIRHDGTALRLLWNRDASVVRSATRAVVWIGDGGRQARIDLDPVQLAGGSIMYWPRSGDVDFRMEVYSPTSHGTESLRAVGAPHPVSEATSAPAPPTVASISAPEPLPAPREPRPSPFVERIGDRSRVDPGAKLPKAPATAAETLVPVATPAKRFELPAATPIAPVETVSPALPPPTHNSAPEPPQLAFAAPVLKAPAPVVPSSDHRIAPLGALVSVQAEPVIPSPKGRLLSRLHLSGRRAESAEFVPPQPAHRPAITVPPNLRARAGVQAPIDVRVYVDPTGQVQYAELETEASQTDKDLAALAVFSARRWQFVPAHIGDRKVPGEVLLKYRFGPESRP